MAKTGRPALAGADVAKAVDSVVQANGAQLVSAQYVDTSGHALGDVTTAGAIPGRAFGVVVEARTDWRPFLLGIIGVTDWMATARATARTPGDSWAAGSCPLASRTTCHDELDRATSAT